MVGLELTQTKVFKDEAPPIVPKSAFGDLKYEVDTAINKVASKVTFLPMFEMPGRAPDFLNLVEKNNVCLENAFMDGQKRLFGFVRVLNISYSKKVTVKWTLDSWETSKETDCEFVYGGSLDNTDQFSFTLTTGALAVGSQVEFCIKFLCCEEYWDNNNGINYIFQVCNIIFASTQT